ncbi:hypothetical protein IP88_11215 [alpha proteobacterium AAP81b]|nr:hypothetical protein IP88_11215 [alpha proteobacterium AAP81b]
MATQFGDEQLEADVRHARLREIVANSEKLQLEGQKLAFERNKLEAERLKLEAERLRMEAERVKAVAEVDLMPRTMIFHAMIATAALLGAGAAISKLFFP